MGRKPTKPQAKGFTFAGYDQTQYKRSDQYAAAIDQLYNAAIADFAKLAGQAKVNPDQCFSFADMPTLQRKAQQIVNSLAAKMTTVIQHGSRESWLYACQKNDDFLAHIMNTAKIGKRQLKKMQDRNLTALDAFQTRKVNGMDLSQRVWKYAGETKDLIELGIDIAVGDGTPATKLASTLKQYLQQPDKLFRRVRDKHGNLTLSKRAAAYHPGQGVYRSSYQNALRLARTEVNMAYRDSDRYRWNQLDFVVGYEVHLSNNHTCKGMKKGAKYKDICDELAGRYPKQFVFKGWHPNCRCYMTPILKDPKEFKTDQEKALHDAFWGDDDDFDANGNYLKYSDSSINSVDDVPESFKKWAKANIEKSKGWAKQPYFIKDNFEGGTLEGELKLVKPVIPKPSTVKEPEHKAWKDLSTDEKDVYRERWRNVLNQMFYDTDSVENACKQYGVDYSLMNKLCDQYEADHSNYYDVDQAESELKRLSSECNRVRDVLKVECYNALERLKTLNEDAYIYGGYSKDPAGYLKNIITDEEKDNRWPKYADLKENINQSYTVWENKIAKGKQEWKTAVEDTKTIIDNCLTKGSIDKTEHDQAIAKLNAFTPSMAKTAKELIDGDLKKLSEEYRLKSIDTSAKYAIPEYITNAKTVKDLERDVVANGDVRSVDLSKAYLEDAKTIVGTVVGMCKRFNLKPIEVNVKGFGRSSAIAWAHGGKVEVSTKYYSKKNRNTNGDSLYDDCVGKYVANKKAYIQQIDGVIARYKDLLAQNNDLYYENEIKRLTQRREKVQKVLDDGFFRHNVFISKETALANTIEHECGHTVHDQLFGGLNGDFFRKSNISRADAASMNADLRTLYLKYRKTCGSWLSEYGTTDYKEFMAESMVLYINQPEKLPKDLLEWFKNLEAKSK